MENETTQKKPPKVYWKQEEIDKVSWSAGQMVEKGEIKTWSAAVMQAQKLVILPNRQRPAKSMKSAVTEFRRNYEKIAPIWKEREARRAERDAAKHPAASLDKKIELPIVTPEATTQQNDHIEEVQGAIVGEFDDMLLETVSKIGAIFRRCLTEELKNVAAHVMTEMVRDIARQSKDYSTIAQYKPAKLRVVVIGFRHGDPGVFRQLFDSKLKLTFIDKGTSPIRTRNTSDMADFVVINTEYCGHPDFEAVKNHPGLIRVEGFTQVKDKLAELAAKD